MSSRTARAPVSGSATGFCGDVVDLHGRSGAAGLLRVLGGDERDRLAEVAHLVHGQDGLVGELEPVALLAGNVRVREDSVDAGHALAPRRC